MHTLDLATGPDSMFRQLLSLAGKVALVSGGGSGIGRGASRLFAAAGAAVYVLDKDETGGVETVRLAAEAGSAGTCTFRTLDVTNAEQCDSVVEEVTALHQRADVLFNCAGLSLRDADMDGARRELLWKVNVDGTKNLCRAVIPAMKQNGFGRIINMGSVVGIPHIEFPLGLHYKASKKEVHDYTLALALELAMFGITANALAPGRVLTDMVLKPGVGWVAKNPDPVEAFRVGCSSQRSGKMLLAEQVAVQALFLCSPFQQMVNGSIIDMSDCWGTAGHKPWGVNEMPAGFIGFRDAAQQTTPTRITPTA